MELLPALIAALILSGAYLFGGWFSRSDASREFWERRRWISAAAGVSVAYVFVDVLPELGALQQVFTQAKSHAAMLFVENRIYVLALISFVVFYGLDHIVFAKRESTGGVSGELDSVYLLHLAGFAAYSGMIGYLLVERAQRGWLALTVYTFVMAVHFLIVGHSLAEEHGLEQQRLSRLLLAGSVLAGWLLGATLPLSELAFARLFAILAGGVVITSLSHELPGKRRGRFWPFCLGAAVFALALLASEAAVG